MVPALCLSGIEGVQEGTLLRVAVTGEYQGPTGQNLDGRESYGDHSAGYCSGLYIRRKDQCLVYGAEKW